MADALTLALAETFARHPGMAARLMRGHVDDGTGRCAGCGGQIRVTWPCVIAGMTTRANEVGRGCGTDRPRPT